MTSSLGLYFLISEGQAAGLRACRSDDALVARWVGEHLRTGGEIPDDQRLAVDRAWWPIHVAFSGSSVMGAGRPPLNRVVFGPEHLTTDDTYIATYTEPAETAEVAAALADVDEADFTRRYQAIELQHRWPGYGSGDLAYAWAEFTEVQTFWALAAERNLGVLFTVDQ